MEKNPKYGILINQSALLHRKYFNEMVRLLGIQVGYLPPQKDKTYTDYGEIIANYQNGEMVGCIFNEHPDQKTLKKIGWVSELSENASIIHVPYDLHDLEAGALFIIPSGLDGGQGKLFRVSTMSNIMVYPSSIACEIVPEFQNTLPLDSTEDFKDRNFTLLRQEE